MSVVADKLEGVILERGPLPVGDLAPAIRRRKSVVIETLRSESRFVHTGTTKDSLWDVRETVDASAGLHAAMDEVTWPPDFEEAEEALVTLIRQRRQTPEDALLRLVSAWAAA